MYSLFLQIQQVSARIINERFLISNSNSVISTRVEGFSNFIRVLSLVVYLINLRYFFFFFITFTHSAGFFSLHKHQYVIRVSDRGGCKFVLYDKKNLREFK